MEEETKPLIGRLKRHASGETECFEEEWVTEAVDLMNEAARDLTDAQARIAELEAALRKVMALEHHDRPCWHVAKAALEKSDA